MQKYKVSMASLWKYFYQGKAEWQPEEGWHPLQPGDRMCRFNRGLDSFQNPNIITIYCEIEPQLIVRRATAPTSVFRQLQHFAI
jgi:hypothetical protein